MGPAAPSRHSQKPVSLHRSCTEPIWLQLHSGRTRARGQGYLWAPSARTPTLPASQPGLRTPQGMLPTLGPREPAAGRQVGTARGVQTWREDSGFLPWDQKSPSPAFPALALAWPGSAPSPFWATRGVADPSHLRRAMTPTDGRSSAEVTEHVWGCCAVGVALLHSSFPGEWRNSLFLLPGGPSWFPWGSALWEGANILHPEKPCSSVMALGVEAGRARERRRVPGWGRL